jgi:hypothetical protein
LGGCGDGCELPYYRIKESRDFRCWQIVLQKSFCVTEDNFSGPWARRSNNNVGDYVD